MAYSFCTFAQAKQALAERLYDSGEQFFSANELGVYITEALRSFNAYGNFYRQEFVFPLPVSTTWYDLTNTTAMPNTLRPLTITDRDLLNVIEYHLLEPQTSAYPLVWTGSAQFALSDILNAIAQSRDQLLSDTGCTVTRSLVAATQGRIFLADTVMTIRRVAWIPVTGQSYTPNTVMPSDLWADQSFTAGYPQQTPGYPLTYRRSTEPPLSFDVDIQPAVPGNYDLLTLNAGGTLTTVAPSVLPIPDDWCPVAKWGALAQLFGRDSSAHDALRASYCAMRYNEGAGAMRAAPALLGARINDVPVSIASVTDADFYNANWQGATAAAPTDVYYAGLNMVAVSPVPGSALPYTMTASVVRNMPVPVADGDALQIGRDDLGAVLDEAQHLAMLKCGGAEFVQSLPLHANFLRHCALYNSKLGALSPYLEFLDGMSGADDRQHPLYGKVSPVNIHE